MILPDQGSGVGIFRGALNFVAETKFRGNEDADTVLRAVVTAMFQAGKRKKGQTDFQLISKNIRNVDDIEKLRKFLSFLTKSFEVFRKMRNALNATGDPVTRELTYLNFHHNITGILPLIFVRWYKIDNQESDEAPVLSAIEKVNFRLYGLRNQARRSDSHNVKLAKLAYDYFKGDVSETNIVDEIENLARTTPVHAITDIVKALSLEDDEKDFDFYDWSFLEYFLARWDASNSKGQDFNWSMLSKQFGQGKSSDYYSKEHFLPKNPKKLTEKWSAVPKYKDRLLERRLGNFFLLPHGVNIILSNDTPDEKVSKINTIANAVLGIQIQRIPEFHDKARKAKEALVKRQWKSFDPKFGSRHFYLNVREANETINYAKFFCDFREELMITFALQTWLFEGERDSGNDFLGMLSFRSDGEAFRADHDGGKNAINYVIKLKGQEFSPDAKKIYKKRSQMLQERNQSTS